MIIAGWPVIVAEQEESKLGRRVGEHHYRAAYDRRAGLIQLLQVALNLGHPVLELL